MGAGVAYSALGDKQKAFDYLTRPCSCSTWPATGRDERLGDVREGARGAGPGHLVQARSLASAARNIIESLRTKMISGELRATFVAAVHDCYELEMDVLMRLHETDPSGGYQAEALTASERARARVLLET